MHVNTHTGIVTLQVPNAGATAGGAGASGGKGGGGGGGAGVPEEEPALTKGKGDVTAQTPDLVQVCLIVRCVRVHVYLSSW